MNKLLIIFVLASYIFAGCAGQSSHNHEDGHDHSSETPVSEDGRNHAEDHDHDHATEDGHNHSVESASTQTETAESDHNHGDEIIFTPEQAAANGFEYYTVAPTAFHEIIPASGQILSAQGDEATVVASFSGVVSLTGNKLTQGIAINKGEKLFYISSKSVAEGDYASRVKASYEQGKSAMERAEKLIADKIISQAEYEQTKLNYENARAAFDALQGKVSEKGTAITAPISGYLTAVLVGEGSYVEVGQPLATISQNRRLTLRADVSQKYFNQLKSVTTANFKISSSDKTYSLKDLGGKLTSTAKSISANSPYLTANFEFNNNGEVTPGAYVDIFLISAQQQNVLAIPISSLIEEQGIYSVFVQIDEEGYAKHPVTLGANDGTMIHVKSGLNGGEKVVSKGAINLKLASASGAIPAGHNH